MTGNQSNFKSKKMGSNSTLTCKSSPGTGFAVYLRLPASLSQAEKGQPQSGQDTPGKEHVR